jgi:biopolymer transport protein TolQ
LKALDRALLRAAGVEVSRLENASAFLATTASISPYIGLFGTVIGIMNAFLNIGSAGSSSLGVVAPGIAGSADRDRRSASLRRSPAVYFTTTRLPGKVKAFTSRWMTSRWNS